jgi:hypothetical protein
MKKKIPLSNLNLNSRSKLKFPKISISYAFESEQILLFSEYIWNSFYKFVAVYIHIKSSNNYLHIRMWPADFQWEVKWSKL